MRLIMIKLVQNGKSSKDLVQTITLCLQLKMAWQLVQSIKSDIEQKIFTVGVIIQILLQYLLIWCQQHLNHLIKIYWELT